MLAAGCHYNDKNNTSNTISGCLNQHDHQGLGHLHNMEYEQELAHGMDKDGLMSTEGATGTKDQQGRKRKLIKRDEPEDERIECGEENTAHGW